MSAYILKGDIGPEDPGVRIYFGTPGSGKSYKLKQDTIAAARSRVVIVVDATREYADDNGSLMFVPPPGMVIQGARTVPRVLERLDTMKAGIIVYHPRVWIEDTTALVSVLAIRGNQKPRIGIAISEAHNLMPNGQPLTPGFDAVVTRWRHLHLAAWFDTQRPARLARTVTELATVVHLFAVNGPRDADAVAELVTEPKDLYAANDEACRRFAAGEAGWHVRLGINRSPPYDLVRA